MVDNRLPDKLKEVIGIKKVWAFIVSNGFMVPLQMFALALIPVQFLYFVNIITTSLFPGILFGVIFQIDARNGFEVFTATLPHYFVEVFAFCLFAAVLFELNQAIRIKIGKLFRKDKDGISLIRQAVKTIKVYVLFVLPLITVGAFLETYVGDIILNLIQK